MHLLFLPRSNSRYILCSIQDILLILNSYTHYIHISQFCHKLHFEPISTNSLMILMVLIATKSPWKDLLINASHISRQLILVISGRSTDNCSNLASDNLIILQVWVNKENSIEFPLDFVHYLYNYYMVCALLSYTYHVTQPCDILICDIYHVILSCAHPCIVRKRKINNDLAILLSHDSNHHSTIY